MKSVYIVDYGMGNLYSVARAVEYCRAEPKVTANPNDIANAEYLILPGVGAFGKAMAELKARELVDPLLEYAQKGRPFLGICLGMQLLLSSSEEFGLTDGLDLIKGLVTKMVGQSTPEAPFKVPHIGWNSLFPSQGDSWRSPLLEDIPLGASVYFVHSYMATPEDETSVIASTEYFDLKVPAIVASGNVFGCQFHPEKSGPTGLRIIQNFLNL